MTVKGMRSMGPMGVRTVSIGRYKSNRQWGVMRASKSLGVVWKPLPTGCACGGWHARDFRRDIDACGLGSFEDAVSVLSESEV